MFSAIRLADFCLAGAVLTYQLMPKLQIGAELFHQTADSHGTRASSSVGAGWRYDIDKNVHLLGYVRRGIENTESTLNGAHERPANDRFWPESVVMDVWLALANST